MLRHLIGLVVGLILTPLLWLGVAWAATGVEPVLRGEGFGAPLVMPAVAVLMLIGVVCGFLAGARVSPLAALVSGGLILAFSLWPVLNPASLSAALPGWIAQGTFFHPVGPALPIALPLGTLLFISALAPSRWRRSAMPQAGPVAPTVAAGDPGAVPPQPGPGRREPEGEPGPGAQRFDAPPHAVGPGTGGDANTTIPFRRDPQTGAAEPGWDRPAPGAASHTRVFGDEDRR
ncbi:hypothetical protein HNR23_000134 [Nocardiopsis mwathae]|uniref:Uncharacterized protein n=1 Tax=Nocardiopsis mwathae TaxID=1472723 RepID=A0A7X0D4H4_9ACTN|nr:hypothetical protein [Nocardiopsis mwathae]MBB6170074.1 hypothetical protein [Nocardiopsis mwathae]